MTRYERIYHHAFLALKNLGAVIDNRLDYGHHVEDVDDSSESYIYIYKYI